jgi:stage II sporulation protein D
VTRSSSTLCLLLLGAVVPACVDGVETSRALPRSTDTEWVSVDVTADSMSCSGECVGFDSDGRLLVRFEDVRPGTTVEASLLNVRLGDRDLGPPPIELHPVGDAVVSVGDRALRGHLRIEFSERGDRPRILNRLPLEEYLLAVVPSEMPDYFGLEAVKAQAVAARSYALAEMARAGRLYGDTRSQAYGGRGSESALGTRAVRETTGEILRGESRVVTAYYHSTCGGRTIAPSLVFELLPGVRDVAVPCPDCRHAPFYRWERQLAAADVVRAVGLGDGPLDAVDVETDPHSGRAARVTVRAAGQEVVLGAGRFRELLSEGRPLAGQLLSVRFTAPPRLDGDALVIAGRGWGHGVGMCQYGASGFARRGADHVAILKRYYPGASIERLR